MTITITHSKYLFNLMYAAAITASSVSAEAGVNETESSEWDVSLGAGALNVSTHWKGAGDQISLIPLIDIRKENWHFNGDDLIGYHGQIGGGWSASVGLGFRSDGYDSDDLRLNKMKGDQIFDGYHTPDTETTVNYGITYGWITLGGSRDVSGKSDANSVGLSSEIPIFQVGNRLYVNAIASVDWYDENYVNYYYGISGKQIDDSVGRVRYRTGGATNFSIGLSASYQVNDLWSVVGILSRTKLDDSIVDSPLTDSSYVDSAGFIFVRTF